MGQASSNWKKIIWREWRHTEDREYARHLFDLVVDKPVGWGVTIFTVLLGTFYGVLSGLLSSLVYGLVQIIILSEISLLTWTTMLGFILAGSILGGTVGFLGPIYKYRVWCFWWRKRPYLPELEAALQKAQSLTVAKKAWITLLRQLEQRKKQDNKSHHLTPMLQSKHWGEFIRSKIYCPAVKDEFTSGANSTDGRPELNLRAKRAKPSGLCSLSGMALASRF
jgi:hypothetical protein